MTNFDLQMDLSQAAPKVTTTPSSSQDNRLRRPPIRDEINRTEIETLEPYQPSRNRGRDRGHNGRRPRPGRREPNFPTPAFPPLGHERHEADFKKFFYISSPSDVNLSSINVIKANDEIERAIQGRPKNINEVRSGQLIVEVSNRAQSQAITNLKTLDSHEITVEPHRTLNQS
jgi:hypothetical protein